MAVFTGGSALLPKPLAYVRRWRHIRLKQIRKRLKKRPWIGWYSSFHWCTNQVCRKSTWSTWMRWQSMAANRTLEYIGVTSVPIQKGTGASYRCTLALTTNRGNESDTRSRGKRGWMTTPWTCGSTIALFPTFSIEPKGRGLCCCWIKPNHTNLQELQQLCTNLGSV